MLIATPNDNNLSQTDSPSSRARRRRSALRKLQWRNLRRRVFGHVCFAGQTFLNEILPPVCPVTLEPVERQGMLASRAFQALDLIAPPCCRVCGRPFASQTLFDSEEIGEDLLCAECLNHPPPFDKARAALVYNDGSRRLILAFKHGDKTFLTKTLVPFMYQAGRQILDESDYLVPVPLHYFRLLHRRYNQSALLSTVLSRLCGKETLLDALIRLRHTPMQGRRSAEQRRKNVRAAFALRPGAAEKINGKAVCLIDDVYTTGATVRECAKELKRMGASRVFVLTLSRTSREVG